MTRTCTTFTYKAKNTDGILVSGHLMSERRETAITTLKNRGYYIISVDQEARLLHFLQHDMGWWNLASVKDKAIFTHQLASLLRAGVQLTLALKTLSQQTENKHLASVILQLHSDIEESSSLSAAMRKHPRIFSSMYSSIVEAAEQSGSLAETLTILSEQLKVQHAVRTRIRGAMVYPIFLLFASAVVVVVLTTFVVPKFIELFISSGQELPLPTKILHVSMAFLRTSWWLILLLFSGFIGLFFIALHEDHFRLAIHRILLNLPLVGKINKKMQLARFARTLGSLLHGGVRILSAIRTTKGSTTNMAFAGMIDQIEDALLKGSSLAKAVKQQPYCSEIAVNMIAVGEETGMLPEMLIEVADMYDQECESTIDAFTTLLGPLMIFILGGIVGFIVMAILLPIFETSSMIR